MWTRFSLVIFTRSVFAGDSWNSCVRKKRDLNEWSSTSPVWSHKTSQSEDEIFLMRTKLLTTVIVTYHTNFGSTTTTSPNHKFCLRLCLNEHTSKQSSHGINNKPVMHWWGHGGLVGGQLWTSDSTHNFMYSCLISKRTWRRPKRQYI